MGACYTYQVINSGKYVRHQRAISTIAFSISLLFYIMFPFTLSFIPYFIFFSRVHEVMCIILTRADTRLSNVNALLLFCLCRISLTATDSEYDREAWTGQWIFFFVDEFAATCHFCLLLFSTFFLFAFRFCFEWYFVAIFTSHTSHPLRIFVYKAFSVFLWMGKIMVNPGATMLFSSAVYQWPQFPMPIKTKIIAI